MRVIQHLWSSLLRSEIKQIIPSPLHLRTRAYAPITAVFMVLFAVRSTTFADSATWIGGAGDCNVWELPRTGYPARPMGTGRYSHLRRIQYNQREYCGQPIEVNSIVFNSGANAFTIDVSRQVLR